MPRIGMTRRDKKGSRVIELDDTAGLHHGHPVAVMRGDAEIPGADELSTAAIAGQFLHQVEHLALDRDIESRQGSAGAHLARGGDGLAC
jgi:hypothetical protein